MEEEEILEESSETNITSQLIYFAVKEHRFKKDIMYKNMVHISNLIVDDSTAQSLTPTINSILETSLKNDKLILQLIEILKKYGDDDIGREEENEDDPKSDELMELIQESSEERDELEDQLDKKIEESAEYNEEVTKEKEKLDKLSGN